MSICFSYATFLLAAAPAAQNIELSGPLVRASSAAVVDAALSPDGSWAVYRADQVNDEVFDLYSVPSDRSQPEVQLNPALPTLRSVSSFQIDAAGTRVVFLASLGRRLYGTAIDGASAPVELVPDLGTGRAIVAFQISPDGARVVYTADQDANDRHELYSLPLDASAPPTKISGPLVAGGDVRFPAEVGPSPFVRISPGGGRVAYLADQDTNGVDELYSVPIAGGASARKLNGALVAGGRVVDFLVSPDSRWIAYRAYQDTAGTLELYGVPADGSSATVKLNPELVAGGDVGARDSCDPFEVCAEVVLPDGFQISADSRQVVYWADQEELEVFELFSAPIEGLRPKKRRPGPSVVKLSPDLGPEHDVLSFQLDPLAARAVFLVDSGSGSQLYGTPLDRRAPVRLDGPPASSRDVVQFWLAPTGGRVVYFGDEGAGYTLHAVPIDGHEPPLDLHVYPFDLELLITADGERILYKQTEFYPHGQRVFSMKLDGTDLTVLGNYRTSQWSLETRGARVIYMAGELFGARIDQSTSEVRLNGDLLPPGPILGTVSEFQLSSDGRYAVYRADQDTNDAFELYSVTLQGRLARRKLNPRFTPGTEVRAAGFQIAPDAQRVFYISDQEVNDRFELFGVPIDGGGPPAKVSGPMIAAGDVQTGFRMSPDGAWVLYRADAELDERFELYAAPTDGSGVALKLNAELVSGGDVQPNQPDRNLGLSVGFRISPDGDWVVYRADQELDGRVELYRVPIDGGLPALKLNGPIVANHDDVQIDFQISSDSQRVAYRACQNLNGFGQLYSVAIDGSGSPLELNGSLAGSQPFHKVNSFLLTPDGERAVYVADGEIPGDTQHEELYSVPLDRSQPPVTLSGPIVVGGGVSPNIYPPGIPDFNDDGFRISTDGARVVFKADKEVAGWPEVYSVPVDGSAPPVKLTSGLRVQRFSTRGDSVVANAGSPTGLYSMPLDGGASPLQLNGAHSVSSFQTPAGGRHVFYIPYPSNNRLFAVPIDGRAAPKQFNKGVGFALYASVETTLDGTRVVYLPDPGSSSTGKSLFMTFLPRHIARR